MVEQTVLSFKLEKTEEEITSHAGLAIFGEFFYGLGIRQLARKYLPHPEGPRGYKPWEVLEPMILMLTGGGRAIEDLRVIRSDTGLLELLDIEGVPSSDAVRDWIKNAYQRKGIEGMEEIVRKLLKIRLNKDFSTEYTLDIDATAIKSEKKEAKMTYKGFKGYMPMLGHLAENGMVVGWEFREGNESPNSRNLEFIKKCVANMPKGKKVKYLRADSATYQSEVYNWCEENDVLFAIGGRLDASTRRMIESIPVESWKPYKGKNSYEKITEVVHSMNHTDSAFRLIVIQRPFQAEFEGMETDESEEEKWSKRYRVIATNFPEKYSPEKIVQWYNQRGDTSENRIKELKNDFGMERMPSKNFGANAMYFSMGVLTYNLYVMFRTLVLREELRSARVLTARWRLFNMAGRIVYHARQVYLKVSRVLMEIFGELRSKIHEIYLEVKME
jgi:hypothetical protein